MKHCLVWAWVVASSLLGVLHGPVAAAGADASGVSVHAAAAAVTVTPSTDPPQTPDPYHVISGLAIELPIVIHGHHDGPFDLRARLVQRARLLAAAFEPQFDVLSAPRLEQGQPIHTTLTLTPPPVRDVTDFELIYQINTPSPRTPRPPQPDAQSDQGHDPHTDPESDPHTDAHTSPWVDAGRTAIRVYPDGILQPLEAISQRVALQVNDDPQQLTAVLEALNVAVTDPRAAVLSPHQPVVTLWVNPDPPAGRVDPRDLPITPGQTMVVFNEAVGTLPKVVKTPVRGGWLVEVDLVVLADLPTDPRAQTVFMEIIQLALPRQPGVTP